MPLRLCLSMYMYVADEWTGFDRPSSIMHMLVFQAFYEVLLPSCCSIMSFHKEDTCLGFCPANSIRTAPSSTTAKSCQEASTSTLCLDSSRTRATVHISSIRNISTQSHQRVSTSTWWRFSFFTFGASKRRQQRSDNELHPRHAPPEWLRENETVGIHHEWEWRILNYSA